MSIEMENINLIKEIAKDIETIKKSLSNQMQKRWLNTQELSKYLGYSKDRIYKLKDEVFIENIHFYKKVGKILYDRVAIDDWMVGKESDETNSTQRQIVDRVLSSIKEI
jgi:predicted DNA-binding transcriptional regulator AlpA